MTVLTKLAHPFGRCCNWFSLKKFLAFVQLRAVNPAVYFLMAVLAVLSEIHIQAQSWNLTLTQAVQVLNLNISQAQSAVPVKIQGVVISGKELETGTAVICDGKASIFIRSPQNLLENLSRSNLVEIDGVTDAGEFAPIVIARKVRVLGQGNIPLPIVTTYEDLISGHLDSQWVEISGCLRSSVYLPTALPSHIGGTEIELVNGGGRLVVELCGNEIPLDWIDGLLRVRGICFHKFNNKHQLYQTYVVVPEGEEITLLRPPASKPDELPIQSIGALLQYAQAGNYGHRIHIGGVVTYLYPGEYFFIHDRGRGLFVRSKQEGKLSLGDAVSVIGFPTQGDYSPILEDAVFTVLSHSEEMPLPNLISHPNEAFGYDAELICGRAKLIGAIRQNDGWVFSLQMDDSVFTAFLRQPSSHSQFALKFPVGSEVSFTGVCAVVMGSLTPRAPLQSPQSFRVLLRSEQDLNLIKLPPWWTPQRILIGAIILTLVLTFIIILTIVIARGRLQQQVVERRQAEVEFSAILKERNRLAREIHDTLAQDLSAISAQLEVARKKMPLADGVIGHLNLAQDTARKSLQEARRSIWKMRSQVLEGRDLCGVLSELLEQEARGAGVRHEIQIQGAVRRLSSMVENDLLRIGQEAIHNAIRHARPNILSLRLAFSENHFSLIVQDDGCGFDMEKTGAANASHFGLKGMRERVGQCGGRLQIESRVGWGTRIMVEIPMI